METPTSPLWPSWRLVYTLCAFLAIVVQLCMSNALNFAILCMIKPSENQTSAYKSLRSDATCSFDLADESPTVVDIPTGEFTWSKHREWVLLSSYFYGFMIVQPAAGRLADKFGGKFFLLAGIIGQAIIFMLIPAMARTHYWLAVLARSAQGFLAGFVVPAFYQLYTVWAHPNERAALMSFAYGGYAIGSLSVFPVSSFLCRTGWPNVFYVIGGIGLSVGLMCLLLVYNTLEAHPWISEKELSYLKDGKDDKKMVPDIPWKKMFTSCPIITFMVTHICHSYGLIVLNLILPTYLRDTMHFNLKENGFYSSAIHVGSLTSRLIVMFTIARLYKMSKLSLTTFRRIVYCTGNVLTVLSLLAITELTCAHRMIIVVLIFLIGATIDVSFTGAYWISCLDMAPAFAGLVTGISNSASTLSGILIPLALSNVVAEGTKAEWNYLYYSMAASYVIAIVVYGSFGSSEKQEWGDFVSKTPKTESTGA